MSKLVCVKVFSFTLTSSGIQIGVGEISGHQLRERNKTMTSSENNCATLTIRLIRSFTHANWKPFVIHNVDLGKMTTDDLVKLIYEKLPTASVGPPFKTYKGFDTLKIETRRFGFKTNDPLINREGDEELILKTGLGLAEQGVGHETEISFFNMVDYLEYKKAFPC